MNKEVLMIGRIGAGPAAGGWYRDDDTGQALYKVRSGDTLGALASKYMGAWGRYMEIWNAQPASRRAGGSPNSIRTGESLVMPQDAIQRAIALGYLAAGAVAPVTPPFVAPPFIPPAPVIPPLVVVNPPAAPTPTPAPPAPPPAPSDGPSAAVYVAGGVAAAVGLAGLAWLALRKPSPSRSARR